MKLFSFSDTVLPQDYFYLIDKIVKKLFKWLVGHN